MSQTWVIKDTAPVDPNEYFSAVIINFTSNNESFTSLGVVDGGFTCELQYNGVTYAGVNLGNPQSSGVFEWDNDAYKTIIFDTVPTGTLLEWLQKNADLIKDEETHRYQDIHLSDVDLNTQFKQYMSAGQYEAALAILQNDQLTDKTVVAALFNYVARRLVEVQSTSDPTFKQDVIKVSKTPPVGMATGQVYFKLKE